jgi:hypothetical protein
MGKSGRAGRKIERREGLLEPAGLRALSDLSRLVCPTPPLHHLPVFPDLPVFPHLPVFPALPIFPVLQIAGVGFEPTTSGL